MKKLIRLPLAIVGSLAIGSFLLVTPATSQADGYTGTTIPSTTTPPVSPTTTTPVTTTTHPFRPIVETLRPFAEGVATLNASVKSEVRGLAQLLKTYHFDHVQLVGYSDNVGPRPQWTRGISYRRALNVQAQLKSDLQAIGDTAVVVTAVGRGDASPVASNATAAGRALNRRVVATITK